MSGGCRRIELAESLCPDERGTPGAEDTGQAGLRILRLGLRCLLQRTVMLSEQKTGDERMSLTLKQRIIKEMTKCDECSEPGTHSVILFLCQKHAELVPKRLKMLAEMGSD